MKTPHADALPESGARGSEFSQTPDPKSLVPIVHRLRRGPWLQLFTPWRFEWNRYELPVPNLPPTLAGLKIVHLTDIHLRPGWRRVHDEVLSRVRDAAPDLILISGDLIEHKFNHRPSIPTLERFCTGLSAPAGVFAILGNHDGDLVAAHLTRCGVQLVNRRIATICYRDTPVEVLGAPGVLRDDLDDGFAELVPSRSRGSLRILMTHFPDTMRQLAILKPDLVLTGHTHGGQVCLPGGIPVLRHDTLPRHLCSGVHRAFDTWLVIGRGLGFATHQIRLFCPAEVIELELRPA